MVVSWPSALAALTRSSSEAADEITDDTIRVAATSNSTTDNVMKIATQIREHINGCDLLPKMAQDIHGMVYQDLDKIGLKISDLAPDIQDAINKAGPGEATPPFKSIAGIEMMVRCDKRAPTLTKWTPPTRQQVEESLFDQQITALSRRYLRDLRRSANVEVK